MERRILWLTWEKQVRNRSLSSRMDAQLVEIIEPGSRLRRYLRSVIRTSVYLWRWRGRAIIVQNPSLVLALQSVLLKQLFRYRLVIDSHNAGLYPMDGRVPLLTKLANIVIRQADNVIVTNRALAAHVSENGGHPVVLPDPLPAIPPAAARPESATGRQVLFICTWASDEPYFEVFDAAALLPDISFFITGNSRGKEMRYGRPVPGNIVLTGYLPEAEYHQLMMSCDVVVDLTTRENCLVCGAYEAVAVGRPFVLSDTAALREYFHKGGTHVANNAAAIAQGIRRVLVDYERHAAEISEFRGVLEQEWRERLVASMALIAG